MSGTIVLAARGNSFNAFQSGGANVGTKLPSSLTTAVGGIGGTVWDLTNTAIAKEISFTGFQNTPNSRNHSILIRLAPSYTGTPAAVRGLFSLMAGGNTSFAYLEFWHANTTGQLSVIARNENGLGVLATQTVGVWAPTSGTFNDVVLTWDGTASSPTLKVYIDAVLLGSINGQNGGLAAGWNNTFWKSINVGWAPSGTISAFTLDEFVIWDGIIDPTVNQTLTGGPGLLNGASRTQYLQASNINGSVYTDPLPANVRNGTGYTFAGVAETGTAIIPTAANVRLGTAVDATTGTLNLPAVSDVRLAVTYDGATKTGTVRSPPIGKVQLGFAYDASDSLTGTMPPAGGGSYTFGGS